MDEAKWKRSYGHQIALGVLYTDVFLRFSQTMGGDWSERPWWGIALTVMAILFVLVGTVFWTRVYVDAS